MLQYEEKDIGHAMAPADPVSALKWVYTELGFVQNFYPDATDPLSVGELIDFD